jgi:hypothetical protein
MLRIKIERATCKGPARLFQKTTVHLFPQSIPGNEPQLGRLPLLTAGAPQGLLNDLSFQDKHPLGQLFGGRLKGGRDNRTGRAGASSPPEDPPA